jgi:hypothetical protein
MERIIRSSVAGSVVVTVAFPAFIFVFTLDTECALGYSEEAFRAIEIGDSYDIFENPVSRR